MQTQSSHDVNCDVEFLPLKNCSFASVISFRISSLMCHDVWWMKRRESDDELVKTCRERLCWGVFESTGESPSIRCSDDHSNCEASSRQRSSFSTHTHRHLPTYLLLTYPVRVNYCERYATRVPERAIPGVAPGHLRSSQKSLCSSLRPRRQKISFICPMRDLVRCPIGG